MTRLAVIDHGAGNLVSIGQGLTHAGADVVVATGPHELRDVDGIVLPGVGTTGAAMARLRAEDLVSALRDFEGPVLGICVGLQLFFDFSEEDEGGECLGLIPGAVCRLEDAPLLPHMGWNDVATTDDRLFAGLKTGSAFYFAHSFAAVPHNGALIIGRTEYGSTFATAVRHGHLVGVQFHPERSGQAGLTVLGNFVAACREVVRAA